MAAAEHVDAVVVGGRCAGAAAGIALARAGRRVVVLDRAQFPSDTLSTHLLFPAGLAEVKALGAYERVMATGAPEHREASVGGGGFHAQSPYSPNNGVAHGACIRRSGFDAALAATAREAGAELRERTKVTRLLYDAGRVAGVAYETRDGQAGELRAPLVVGADGRQSAIARELGVSDPYRWNKNRRACYFTYVEDERDDGSRNVAAQWREGAELGTAFPCDDGLLLVLLMPPVGRAGEFKRDLEDEYRRTIAAIPGLQERIGGGKIASKVRMATETTSFFRRSSGKGWALAGDAGHFKDPVTAQGMRDAMRFGRLLGEMAAPAIGDVKTLDRALASWERLRERECIETYQWTNQLARAEAMTPIEVELYREISSDADKTRELLDVFSRQRKPSRVLGPARVGRLVARAWRNPELDNGELARAVRRDGPQAMKDAITRARTRAIIPGRRPSGPGASARPRSPMRTMESSTT